MSEQVEKKEEELNKSIDTLIDEFFAEEAKETSEEVKKSEPKAEEKKEEGSTESIEKASDAVHAIIGEAKQAKEEKDPNKNSATTADDADNNAPKGEEDEKAGKKRGRPKDISSWADRPADGGTDSRQYDRDITEASVSPSKPEDSQVKPPEHMKKADENTVTISKEEYETLKSSQAESLKKAEVEKVQEQEKLVKAEIEKATGELRKENEELKKKMDETSSLVKSMLRKPQPRKSVASVGALEKSAEQGSSEEKEFTKSDMLDAAEALVKSGTMSTDDVIELETTGTLLDPRKKDAIERKLRS